MKPHLLVIDSGVGGISILKELLAKTSGVHYTYLADQKNFPYGNKDNAWISKRLNTLVGVAIDLEVAAVVVACNTATVHSLDEIRNGYPNLSIFGVEPVVKPLSAYNHPVLLSTKSTASSSYLENKIKSNNGHQIKNIAATGLAQAVEEMDQNKITQIFSSLGPKLRDSDAIGLSCTHYPLAKDIVSRIYPNKDIIDPSSAVAKHVSTVLNLPITGKQNEISFLTTGDVLRLNKQVLYYMGQKVQSSKIDL